MEPESGLDQRFATLSVVAGSTSTDQIIPRVDAATGPGNDVVNSEFTSSHTAVLASEVITNEDLTPAKFNTGAWTANHVRETDYRGRIIAIPGCRHADIVRLEDFRFTGNHEDDRPPNVADIERLVIMVQNENRMMTVEVLVTIAELSRFGVVQAGPLSAIE